MPSHRGPEIAGNVKGPNRKTRGGQPEFSDFAIETCLTLGLIFHHPLRQTQDFVQSLLTLKDLELPVPDFSTLKRRAIGLSVEEAKTGSTGPFKLVV